MNNLRNCCYFRQMVVVSKPRRLPTAVMTIITSQPNKYLRRIWKMCTFSKCDEESEKVGYRRLKLIESLGSRLIELWLKVLTVSNEVCRELIQRDKKEEQIAIPFQMGKDQTLVLLLWKWFCSRWTFQF